MYKCLKSDFDALQKRINSIGRKLDKYGLQWNFTIIAESAEKVGIYKIDHVNHVQYMTDEIVLDVISYDFNMEQLKLGEWVPVAVIEHNSVIGNTAKNMVYSIDNADLLPEWRTIDCKCEHCNNNRKRTKTVILQDTNGQYKQVGTTCVKDFTGIDAADIIRLYASVSDILIKEPRLNDGENIPQSNYINTFDYLKSCVDEIAVNGYRKEVTKYRAYEKVKNREKVSVVSQNKAKEIIDFFADMKPEDMGTNWSFYNNIQIALQNEYNKISGFIAYAPIAYEKALEVIKCKQAEEAHAAASQWQGNIKDKFTTSVIYQKSINYETSYNCHDAIMQFIHFFTDNDGNIYKWSTGKRIQAEPGSILNITGTVKAHSEYKGAKQTVLTRCKVS